MSARRATTGPGRPPRRTPTTPVLAPPGARACRATGKVGGCCCAKIATSGVAAGARCPLHGSRSAACWLASAQDPTEAIRTAAPAALEPGVLVTALAPRLPAPAGRLGEVGVRLPAPLAAPPPSPPPRSALSQP